jgi:hypothetical protein
MFYSRFFIDNELPPSTYKLKFIVDGEWLCNGDLPISQDMGGNYNNIITIERKKSKPLASSSARKVKPLKAEQSMHELNPSAFREAKRKRLT